ncbi:MAG: DJ-1/PfpI family protein [Actinobacteria bacterium]|nr:DJ-1/PfpI family protein [Actinomycetota bacterium]
MRTLTIGLLLFEDVDLLDVGGPYEVFLTAARLVARDGDTPPFEVTTVGVTPEPVSAYGGLRLVPQRTLDDAGDLDVLVVPGAVDIHRVRGDRTLSSALADAIARAPLVTSVCTGAFLLADHGLLHDRSWTTHWEDISDLATDVTSPPADGAPRWVDTGAVVTAGGLSSGIAMALHLVDRLAGRDLALRTARQIDYVWDPDDGINA